MKQVLIVIHYLYNWFIKIIFIEKYLFYCCAAFIFSWGSPAYALTQGSWKIVKVVNIPGGIFWEENFWNLWKWFGLDISLSKLFFKTEKRNSSFLTFPSPNQFLNRKNEISLSSPNYFLNNVTKRKWMKNIFWFII